MRLNREDHESQEAWVKFCDMRVAYLRDLAKSVERGLSRKDTAHPAFCGCIDWHSSVHGTYALLATSRLTGEPRWRDVVTCVLSTERIAGEFVCLRVGELDHELPYGFAWFLKLAQEREGVTGNTDLLPLANEIALRLKRWVFSLSEEEIRQSVLRREYGNLSWAVLNLWEWSCWNNEKELREKLRMFTKHHLLPLDSIVPQSYDHNIDEFFAASLQRTRAILTILDPEEGVKWQRSFYSERLSLAPVSAAPRPHSGGLNFSRAWGLWSLYKATGDVVYRDLYVNHIVRHMEMPELWRDDYKKYSHWVPQFGIYAIALSMDTAEKQHQKIYEAVS